MATSMVAVADVGSGRHLLDWARLAECGRGVDGPRSALGSRDATCICYRRRTLRCCCLFRRVFRGTVGYETVLE